MRLPRGCRFDPNEFELIQYLFDKVAGCPDPGQGLIKDDIDVYGTSPDLLPVDLMASGGDGRLFCFAPIRFRKGPPCRDRSTPDGHWKATNARSSIKDEEGKPIGFTQTFSYYHGKKGPARTKWIMKEYTLFAAVPQNVALCVIYSTLNKFNELNQERVSFLKPIPKKYSVSYNASSKDDGSNLKSSQGSPSTDQISMSYSSDVGGCSGSVSIIGTGNGLMDDPPWSESSWEELLSFNEEDILSVAELACLPDNGCPDGVNTQSDVLKAKDVALDIHDKVIVGKGTAPVVDQTTRPGTDPNKLLINPILGAHATNTLNNPELKEVFKALKSNRALSHSQKELLWQMKQQLQGQVDHIKADKSMFDDSPEVFGERCQLCKLDLAFLPDGSRTSGNDPSVHAVLPCGHCFHSRCLVNLFGPLEPGQDPLCTQCLEVGANSGI